MFPIGLNPYIVFINGEFTIKTLNLPKNLRIKYLFGWAHSDCRSASAASAEARYSDAEIWFKMFHVLHEKHDFFKNVDFMRLSAFC